jgi:hypothetical protein
MVIPIGSIDQVIARAENAPVNPNSLDNNLLLSITQAEPIALVNTITSNFPQELLAFRGLVGTLDALQAEGKKVTYYKAVTDSSRARAYEEVFEFILPRLKKLGYTQEQMDDIKYSMGEAGINSALHGNGGGEEEERKSRGLPIPPDFEANKKKPVDYEILLSEKFCLIRVSDQGDGLKMDGKPVTIQEYIDRKRQAVIESMKNPTLDYLETFRARGNGLMTMASFMDQYFSNKTTGKYATAMIKFRDPGKQES